MKLEMKIKCMEALLTFSCSKVSENFSVSSVLEL